MTLPEASHPALRPTPYLDRALDRAAGARPIPGNRVNVLHDGPVVYPVMLDIIARAERWIHFENYIIRADETGWRFAEALASRAREGVAVRVLYDWLGSISTPRSFWKYLRDAGVEVRCFNPPKLLALFSNASRDHRKVVVGDGCRAVIGGLCIGDEWSGRPERGVMPWRDTAVEIVGPAAAALDQAFASVWQLAGPPLAAAELASEVPEAGEAEVRVLIGEPGRERTYRVLEYLSAGTIERLWITDAYLVPPPRLFQALLDAARDGADIRLLVPGSSDVPFIRNLTRIGYRDLLRAGIRIFEWDGPMLHAKTAVAESCWSRIGTSNLNASSLLGNYEIDVLIEDPVFAQSMEAQFRQDLEQSLEVERRQFRAPRRLERVIPTGLRRHPAGSTLPRPRRQRGRREFRGRAAVAMRTLVNGARRSVYGPISLGLIVLGLLFLGIPTITAYAFGALCVWFAVAAWIEAFHRRREG
ncbi:MAG: phospholipase D-like domain-containing protein [Gemmatimonadota bacterium]